MGTPVSEGKVQARVGRGGEAALREQAQHDSGKPVTRVVALIV